MVSWNTSGNSLTIVAVYHCGVNREVVAFLDNLIEDGERSTIPMEDYRTDIKLGE